MEDMVSVDTEVSAMVVLAMVVSAMEAMVAMDEVLDQSV